jgi:DNA excision repair protein ERCC-2
MKKVVEHKPVSDPWLDRTVGAVKLLWPSYIRMTNGTSLEAKPCAFAYSRLSSLLRTLQVSKLEEFNALDVADFANTRHIQRA